MGDPSSVSISVLQGPAGYSYIFNGNSANPYFEADEIAAALNAYYEIQMADSQKSLIVSVHCQKDITTVDALLTIIDMINDQNKAFGDIAPGIQRYKMVLATDKK
jgi:hypothetical protein